MQHVIRPQDRAEFFAGRSLDDVGADLFALVPSKLEERIEIQTIVVPGDPTEELLYQSRAQQADLIVFGAQGASAFAAITRHGVVYKTLAHAHCPVITLSPVVLAEYSPKAENTASLRSIHGRRDLAAYCPAAFATSNRDALTTLSAANGFWPAAALGLVRCPGAAPCGGLLLSVGTLFSAPD